jgi:hypothetical protein
MGASINLLCVCAIICIRILIHVYNYSWLSLSVLILIFWLHILEVHGSYVLWNVNFNVFCE